ncbi:hypothetical protein ACQP06_03010 [Nocardia sp. CA-136227]|uniref:hypothetical protein n=1 Tax=Nocardia sp. CA-136227 TaxID=3239979 RepID=UPI003D96C3B8
MRLTKPKRITAGPEVTPEPTLTIARADPVTNAETGPVRPVEVTVTRGLVAALDPDAAAPPPRRPTDIRDPLALRRNEIPEFDPVGRVAAILGEKFLPRLRATLSADAIGELLEISADLERTARSLLMELERCERAATLAAERSERPGTHPNTPDAMNETLRQQRAEEIAKADAEHQHLAERVATARSVCAVASLELDVRPEYDGNGNRADAYRVVTADSDHALLPSEFDAAARAAVPTFIRSGTRFFVLAGPADMDRIERWLSHKGIGGGA